MSLDPFDEVDWPEPWHRVGPQAFQAELNRERGPGHPLFGVRVVAVARRLDRDDVLLALPDEDNCLAVVHLTWSGQRDQDPRFPWTTFYANREDLLERGDDTG
jgi:hypothetical protein